MGTFTYENQGANTILVYSLDTDETMDTLAMGMVANNKIEGILSPGFVQNNTVRQLKYNISSKVTLQKYFSGTVKKKQLIGVFRSLTETLMQAEKYLLEEESFLLDWEQIYVHEGSANAYLICFPIVKEEGEQIDYYEFVHRMIYKIKFDESENCVYVATLMNYINKKDSFTLRSFLEILKRIELETQIRNKNQRAGEVIPNPGMVHGAENIIRTSGVNSPMQTPPVLAEEEKDTEKKKNRRNKKEKKEKEKKRFPLPFAAKKKEEIKQPSFAIPGQPKVMPGDDVPPKKQVRIEEKSAREEIIPSQESYGNTGMEDEETSTVILTKMNKERIVTITRLQNGMTMDIQKVVFRIGRSAGLVDFCIPDNKTVSHSHADILLGPQGVYIRDNNSLNHTYVNDQIVQEGTQVLLSDGDSIRLSDEEFVISIQ